MQDTESRRLLTTKLLCLLLGGCACSPAVPPLPPGVLAEWHYRRPPTPTQENVPAADESSPARDVAAVRTARADERGPNRRSEVAREAIWWVSIVNRTSASIDLQGAKIFSIVDQAMKAPYEENASSPEINYGYWTCDYPLSASPGQMLNITLQTNKSSRCSIPALLQLNSASSANEDPIRIGEWQSAPATLFANWMRHCASSTSATASERDEEALINSQDREAPKFDCLWNAPK